MTEPIERDQKDAECFLAGDSPAGERLFGRNATRLYHYLLGLCRNRELAEDLGQDVVVRLLRHDTAALRTWCENPRGPFWNYLRTVARRLWIDHCKSARHRRVVSLPDPPDPADSRPPKEHAAAEAIRELQRLSGKDLSDRDQHLLALMLAGLSGKQVAAALGVTEGNAWVLIHRLTKKLRGRARELGEKESSE